MQLSASLVSPKPGGTLHSKCLECIAPDCRTVIRYLHMAMLLSPPDRTLASGMSQADFSSGGSGLSDWNTSCLSSTSLQPPAADYDSRVELEVHVCLKEASTVALQVRRATPGPLKVLSGKTC